MHFAARFEKNISNLQFIFRNNFKMEFDFF